MSAVTAELAELRERVDLLDAIVRGLGIPLDQLGQVTAEQDKRLRALSDGLAEAFGYAGVPVPEALQPRSRSHLSLVRGGAS